MKSTVEELKQVLRRVMVKVGLRANNLPAGEEKDLLIEHIITNYGNHTPEEVRLAFDMAIAGKLDIEEKNVICYENFSCLYFSNIMNAYRVWAKEQHKQLVKPMIALPEKIDLNNEERLEWINEWKQKADIVIDLIPLIFYDYLTGMNLLNIDSKTKWQYTENATQQVKALLQQDTNTKGVNPTAAYIALGKFNEMEKSGVFEGEFKGKILNRAKRLIVYDYLTGNNG